MVRKIRAKLVLRLRAEGLSGRAIAASQQMSRKSVMAVFEAADTAGVSWDDVSQRSNDEVYRLLFPGRGEHDGCHPVGFLARVGGEVQQSRFHPLVLKHGK